MSDEARLLTLLVWGGSTVVTYGVSLLRDVQDFRYRGDVRSRRELLQSIGLFMTALCSASSIAVVLFSPTGTGLRGLFVAIALGAFAAAGFVRVSERGDVAAVRHEGQR